jgi:hypothetical protein
MKTKTVRKWIRYNRRGNATFIYLAALLYHLCFIVIIIIQSI